MNFQKTFTSNLPETNKAGRSAFSSSSPESHMEIDLQPVKRANKFLGAVYLLALPIGLAVLLVVLVAVFG